MTSPDFQTPAGALSPAAMNWLQEMLAKPIGQEGKQILQALASIGDSMLSRFFKGYTDIADVFSHAFDELGAELSGIPGMSGVQAWVDDIEGLLTNALDLIDDVFSGVTGIVDGLAFAVTGRSVEGNIAEGMHQVVQGLTVFLELVNAAADMLKELIDGVLGVAGGTMHQLVQVLSWVIGVANEFLLFFNGVYDVFGDLLDFAPGGDRPLAALLAGLPKLLSVLSPLDASKLFGQIPNALITAVWDAISGLLPKNLFDTFLGGLKGSANTGAGGSTGFPTFDDALNAIGGLFGKAQTAQTDAATAKAAAQSAVQTTGITTSGTMGELRWTRQRFTGNGSWTVPSPTPGYRFERFDWQLTGAGCGGPRPPVASYVAMPAALAGGFLRRSFTAAEIGPPGTGYNLTVPAGGAGATSTGLGAVGARAVVRRASDNSVLVQSPEPGTSGIYTSAGIPSTDQKPGNGGTGATGRQNYSNDPSSYDANDDAGAGQPSLSAAGGAAGHPSNGWWGGASAPTAGVDAPTTDPYFSFCGGGGGSAACRRPDSGAPGGSPGGGGGAGSPHNNGFIGAATNGGPGGRAEICIWILEAPL